MGIPHIIHYIWFGGGKHSKLQKRCMKSWEKKCPFAEIKRWDESSFDISKAPIYVRQAYENKKWAFVSDYVRLWVLYNYGGIYFDTDTEILKDISPLFENDAFIAFESSDMVNTGVMGCQKGNAIVKEILDSYENLSFYDEDGNINTKVTGNYVTDVFLKHGLKANGEKQMVDNFQVYPFWFFYPVKVINDKTYYKDDTLIVHWFEGTWFPKEYKRARKHDKNVFVKLFRKLPLADIYYKIRNKE